MGYLRNVLRGALGVLKSLPLSQRYSVAALLGVVAVSLVMLVTWGGRDSYIQAYRDLGGAEISAMQKSLEGSGVDYQFRGDSLWVATGDRHRVGMILATSEALPSDVSSSFGFDDLVAPAGFNLETEAQQRVKFNIALQNTLARGIASVPEIAAAEVFVASQRDMAWTSEAATAGVNIRPRTGARISEDQFRGICHFVAAAVGPKLPPEMVVVTDLSSGRMFKLDDENAAFSRASDRMELQKEWNRYFRERIEDFLGGALGRVQVFVNVDVDAASREKTETEYAVVREKTSESSETGGAAAAGETETMPNTQATVTAGGGGGGETSETLEKEREMGPAKMELTSTPPGELKDIRISVLADLARVEANIRAKDESIAPEDAVPTATITAECESWRAKLQVALRGVQGDETADITKISFSAEPFSQMAISAAGVVSPSTSSRALEILGRNWQRVGLALLAIVALLMVKSVAKRPPEEEMAVAGSGEQEEEEEVDLPAVEVDLEERRAHKMRESIEEMIQKDPQAAASLIRRWIAKET